MAESDVAVVIGIEDYAFLPDVPFAERDAQAVAETLTRSMGIDRSRVTVLTQSPSREQMLRAIAEASQSAGSSGTVWVYFAGHGAADPTSGERVLLGVDAQAERSSFASRGLSLADVTGAAAGRDLFVILDTCFTGRGRTGDDLVPGARMVVPTSWAAPSGVTEWTATSPSEWASPLEGARHGAFTYAVLGALRGWADGSLDDTPDGTVTTEEAQYYVQQALRDVGIRNQRPTFSGTDRVLVSGTRLEAAPDLNPVPVFVPAPVIPPVVRGPKRRDTRVLIGSAAVAGVGLITVLSTFTAGSANPDIRAGSLSTLKVVNGVGWGVFGAGLAVGATAAIVPTRQGATLSVSGSF